MNKFQIQLIIRRLRNRSVGALENGREEMHFFDGVRFSIDINSITDIKTVFDLWTIRCQPLRRESE